MKKFTCISTFALLLSLLLMACKKQIDKPAASELVSLSETGQFTNCKPTVFALYEDKVFFSRWVNIMQKWYSGDRVSYINIEFSDSRFAFMRYGTEHALRLRLGEVTYEGNQVHVRDMQFNRLVFRATLNENGKVLASYYQNPFNAETSYAYDTLYYYYTGYRLDSVIQLSKHAFSSFPVRQFWEKYILSYDGLGNLANIDGFNSKTRLSFVYDYSRPVDGIISSYQLTIPFRIAEFLDLVDLPMHYAISRLDMGTLNADGSYNMMIREQFANFVIDNGVVYAYHYPNNNAFNTVSYYTGWDCGSTPASALNRQPQTINSPEQFQQLYPIASK
ncbi:MAG: hypothetical protein WCF67_17990 [Chitinophagaceae bacterium]